MLDRRYEFTQGPRPLTVEWHVQGCDCPACEPYVASVPPALGWRDLGRLALGGFVIPFAITAAIHGPAAAERALWAMLTWSAL